jgi:hypothetical protein
MDDWGFVVFEWTRYAGVEKAAEGCRSPKPGGNAERPGEREASCASPLALWKGAMGIERDGRTSLFLDAKCRVGPKRGRVGALRSCIFFCG